MVIAPVGFWIGKKYWAILGMLIGMWNVLPMVPLYSGSEQVQTHWDEKPITILSINVLKFNQRYDLVRKEIERYNADIVILSELDQAWLTAILPITKVYPHNEAISREDNFGIGIYSKVPLLNKEIYYFGELATPAVRGTFIWDQDTIDVLGLHPRAPESVYHFRERNHTFNELVMLRPLLSKHLIVAGDLNTTSFSIFFHQFLQGMELKDSRKGFGLGISWPSFFYPLGISLDHVLLSTEWKVIDREIGNYVGSDHYPVYIKLAL